MDENIIHKTSQEVIELCQTPDKALDAITHWIKHQTIEEDAIQAIYDRICSDMDIQSAYYLARILSAMPSDQHPVDIEPLLELVSDIGDEQMQDSIHLAVDRAMLEEINQNQS